eukprot:jgi/Botrbrau1/7573/Bobra.0159s0022.1
MAFCRWTRHATSFLFWQRMLTWAGYHPWEPGFGGLSRQRMKGYGRPASASCSRPWSLIRRYKGISPSSCSCTSAGTDREGPGYYEARVANGEGVIPLRHYTFSAGLDSRVPSTVPLTALSDISPALTVCLGLEPVPSHAVIPGTQRGQPSRRSQPNAPGAEYEGGPPGECGPSRASTTKMSSTGLPAQLPWHHAGAAGHPQPPFVSRLPKPPPLPRPTLRGEGPDPPNSAAGPPSGPPRVEPGPSASCNPPAQTAMSLPASLTAPAAVGARPRILQNGFKSCQSQARSFPSLPAGWADPHDLFAGRVVAPGTFLGPGGVEYLPAGASRVGPAPVSCEYLGGPLLASMGVPYPRSARPLPYGTLGGAHAGGHVLPCTSFLPLQDPASGGLQVSRWVPGTLGRPAGPRAGVPEDGFGTSQDGWLPPGEVPNHAPLPPFAPQDPGRTAFPAWADPSVIAGYPSTRSLAGYLPNAPLLPSLGQTGLPASRHSDRLSCVPNAVHATCTADCTAQGGLQDDGEGPEDRYPSGQDGPPKSPPKLLAWKRGT